MSTEEAVLGLGFWLRWVVAHVAAFRLVKTIGDARSVLALPGRARTVVRGMIVGCVVAAMQWIVLRDASWAGGWALATMLGYAIGFGLGEVVESVVGRRSVGQFLFGGLVGTTQGLVLENAAGVSALVWVVTCAVCLGGTDTALKFLIRRRGLSVPAAVLLLGATIGAGTGIVLVALLRTPI